MVANVIFSVGIIIILTLAVFMLCLAVIELVRIRRALEREDEE